MVGMIRLKEHFCFSWTKWANSRLAPRSQGSNEMWPFYETADHCAVRSHDSHQAPNDSVDKSSGECFLMNRSWWFGHLNRTSLMNELTLTLLLYFLILLVSIRYYKTSESAVEKVSHQPVSLDIIRHHMSVLLRRLPRSYQLTEHLPIVCSSGNCRGALGGKWVLWNVDEMIMEHIHDVELPNAHRSMRSCRNSRFRCAHRPQSVFKKDSSDYYYYYYFCRYTAQYVEPKQRGFRSPASSRSSPHHHSTPRP